MRKILMVLMLIVPTSALAAGQTRGGQSARNLTDERQIIDLSRRFANENVINSPPVVTQVFTGRPKRIVIVKDDGEADPLRMDQVKVSIRGNQAKLMSRLIYSEWRSSGETYERPDSWTVQLVKQDGRWQVVSARLGATGK